STSESGTKLVAQVLIDDRHHTVTGAGAGPISAFVQGMAEATGIAFDVVDYTEHALTSGAGAAAVAYLACRQADGTEAWGGGQDDSVVTAGLQAVCRVVSGWLPPA